MPKVMVLTKTKTTYTLTIATSILMSLGALSIGSIIMSYAVVVQSSSLFAPNSLPVPERIPDASLVSYWPIHAQEGEILRDTVSQPLNFSLSPEDFSQGKIVWLPDEGGIKIQGDGPKIFTDISAGNKIVERIKKTESFTFDIWFAPENVEQTATIISIGCGENCTTNPATGEIANNFYIRQKGKKIQVGLKTNSSNPLPRRETADILVAGAPIHFVYTWKKETNGTITEALYANLTHVLSWAGQGYQTFYLWQSLPVVMAPNNGGISSATWKGNIYLAAIYDRALNWYPEVAQNFKAGYLPPQEICDGKDNDLDGAIDEGSNACGGVCNLTTVPGIVCDSEDADLCQDDVYACDGINIVVCQDQGYALEEICDDQDNDCDTFIDEGENQCGGACALNEIPGNACDSGDTDQCNDDIYVCVGLNGVVCKDEGGSIEEVCDIQDNNCDGIIDEGSNQCGGACMLTLAPNSPCDSDDKDFCTDDVFTCDGLNGVKCQNQGLELQEICDGLDNNCDGQIDEMCPKFRRGDVDDSGKVDKRDIDFIRKGIKGGNKLFFCKDAADVNDNGVIDTSDEKFLKDFVKDGEPLPLPPGPSVPGVDITQDTLDCKCYSGAGKCGK